MLIFLDFPANIILILNEFMSYFVVRDYSHTDKQCLLKVLSRNMVNLQSAIDWADSSKHRDISKSKTQRQKKHLKNTDYYVVQRVEENIELKAERMMFQGWSVSFRFENISVICELKKENNLHTGEGRSMNEAFDGAKLKLSAPAA